MKMDTIANSKNDEFYTPKYAIEPIVKYLKEKDFKKVWCPFDTEESWFVKVLNREGFDVVFSHIETNQNFFEMEVPDCDCIVSNPPYSIKGKVFKYLFEINKPFAMLVGAEGLFSSEERFSLFEKNDFEILYFNKRVTYFKSYDEEKPSSNPPFASMYVCSNILPKQICFERIDKKNY